MNKYRTTPGLGPSKATSSTTCQKCLAKGHYSYECKSSLQSRPYASRASRTQQLRNPKLQPTLAETKMSEPTTDLTDHVPKPEALVDVDRRESRSLSQEPSAKRRRRSLSASSASSVSTISTNASKPDHDVEAPQRSSSPPADQASRTRSGSRSNSAHRKRRGPSSSRSRSPPRFDRHRRRRSRGHQGSRRHSGESKIPYDSVNRSQGGSRSRSPRRKPTSGSPERVQHRQASSAQSRPYRERSLSPFSKRLALTQAMNAGR